MSRYKENEFVLPKLLNSIYSTEALVMFKEAIKLAEMCGLSNDRDIKKILARLDPILQELRNAINAKPEKSKLKMLDEIRDDAAKAFFTVIHGYAHFPDDNIKANALEIEKHIDNLKTGVLNLSYNAEGGNLAAFIHKLDEDWAQQAMQVLPAALECYNTFKEKNTIFENERDEYIQKKAEWKRKKKASQLRLDGLDVYNKELIHFLQSAVRWDSDTYMHYARSLKVGIREINSLIKQRNRRQ